jgi:hypothetical protein
LSELVTDRTGEEVNAKTKVGRLHSGGGRGGEIVSRGLRGNKPGSGELRTRREERGKRPAR